MPRSARIVLEGIAHHITQRGNYRQNVFEDPEDRIKYLELIKEYSTKYELKIYAYCLMNNHVHFIVVPEREDSLAMTFKYAHMRYSQYFNRKHRRTGHLWQGRFYSCPLDQEHAISAVKYIERNPVRAKMVEFPWDYEWSSAGVHVDKSRAKSRSENTENRDSTQQWDSPRFLPLCDLSNLGFNWNPEGWREYLGCPDSDDFLSNIRSNTSAGRPFFSNEKVAEFENALGVSLKRRPRGRPKKGL
ncbi:transposase [Kosmotoga pacifica]|uniref:Transposase IS200-like domain-containing protein n=1 Tax=Kosmotoga pacifica TaxID=1330330 RepID=A0A0G2Z4V6_9BACT|nr:transposase [Kosmotoga pacifica]AKI96645.1 hypothetical protein IX53_01085 [Kosmotoga pacifica]